MELNLQKYRYEHHDYLVYDCEKNQFIIENEEVRVMCSTNFGLDVRNLLIGPIIKNGKKTMIPYNPDGTPGITDSKQQTVFDKYLADAGYENTQASDKVNHVSRIYLCQHFLEDNNIRLAESV